MVYTELCCHFQSPVSVILQLFETVNLSEFMQDTCLENFLRVLLINNRANDLECGIDFSQFPTFNSFERIFYGPNSAYHQGISIRIKSSLFYQLNCLWTFFKLQRWLYWDCQYRFLLMKHDKSLFQPSQFMLHLYTKSSLKQTRKLAFFVKSSISCFVSGVDRPSFMSVPP